jgi:hypothetical protein
LSDAVEEAYQKYILSAPEVNLRDAEPGQQVDCPRCGSLNVDMAVGYRGEYACFDCHHKWQVGGRFST